MRVYILGVLLVVIANSNVVFTTDEECSPRDGYYAIFNTCNQPCVDDEDCYAGEQCRCDGRCGRSCINLDSASGCQIPKQPSPPSTGVALPNPDISPVPFGQHASVRCWTGYTLVGESDITCMANGNWSTAQHYCVRNTAGSTCRSDRLEDVYNGATDVVGNVNFTEGDTVSYTCQPGFVALGNQHHVTCLHGGSWTPIEMGCIRATCGNPGIPEGGVISTYDFGVGSTVTFTCHQGHELVGDNTRSCLYDDVLARPVWTNSSPTCQLMSCSTLSVTSPLNKDISDTMVGTVIEFRCDDGHRLVGETSITCLPNKEWSSNVPTCERIFCSAPSTSPHLIIRHATSLQLLHPSEQIEVGDDIKYECNDATQSLAGDEHRTCLTDLSFSGVEPSCYDSCPELPPLANADTFRTFYPSVTPSRAPGTVVLFYCKERGFFLQGANRCKCVDGSWRVNKREGLLDSNNPRCIAVDGSETNDFSFSMRTPLQYAFGKDNEYQLTVKKGSEVLIDCKRHLSANYWSPYWVHISDNPNKPTVIINTAESPKYKIMTLGNRDDPGWYRLRLNGVTEEDTGKYSCANIGAEEMSTSVWLNIGNTQCEDPGVPENGARLPAEMPSYAPFYFTFSCDEGYTMKGSRKSRCSKSRNYEWSTPLPVCDKIKETGFGKTFPDWNSDNGFSSTSYTTNDEIDEATQVFYCDIGYRLESSGATTAHCTNESRPQWDIAGTPISCRERDRKVTLDPLPAANRRYSLYSETDFFIACLLDFVDSSYEIGWKVKDENGQFLEVSTDSSSRIYTNVNETGAWLMIIDSKEYISGEYACAYHSTEIASQNYEEIISIDVSTSCPAPSDFPHGVISEPTNQDGSYLPGDDVTYSCDEGYIPHGVAERGCLTNGTWEDLGPFECIPDMAFVVFWGTRNITDQTTVQVTSGSDVILDCQTEDDTWDFDPDGELVGWYRIANDGTRQDDHFEQIIMNDGTTLRMFLPRTSTEQAGTYACGTAVNVTAVILDIVVPCSSLDNPDHGSVNGWRSRAGTAVTYHCDDRYRISGGDATRTCLSSGQWSGVEPLCSLAECPALTPPANGNFAVSTPSFDLNTEVSFICADDSEFDIGANSALLCRSDGTWNGNVPECVHKCQNTVCGPGAKCVIAANSNDAVCVCKSVLEDCSDDGQGEVCGSDAQTYHSQCVMEVYACQDYGGFYPTKVANGKCIKRGLCSSRPVARESATKCDDANSYYYNPVLMKCTDTAMDSCMEEDAGFSTRESCDASCTGVNYCNIARDPGPCDQEEPRWFWDSSSSNAAGHTCAEFTYGGCEGNENNFKTRDECLLTCPDRCESCADTMNLFNACDFGHYAIRATVLRLSRFEKTPQRNYPTTFHISIKNVLKTSAFITTPQEQDEYALRSTVLYRGVTCPCPRFLTLDSDYLIFSKLENVPSNRYDQEPIVTEGTYVRLWSEDLECELRCTSTCSELLDSMSLPDCPHPDNPKCSCCS